jgi:hypothetical protein
LKERSSVNERSTTSLKRKHWEALKNIRKLIKELEKKSKRLKVDGGKSGVLS